MQHNITQQTSEKELTLETTIHNRVQQYVRSPNALHSWADTHVPSKILTQNRAISRRHVKAWGHKVAWDAPPCQRTLPLFPLCPTQDGEHPPPFGQISPWQALPFSLLLSKDT